MLEKNQITEATPIQEKSIPKILQGHDLIGKAQTGTGKTLAFLLPVFEKISVEDEHTQCLVIAPTRELALQIAKEADKLRAYKNIRITSAYGGAGIQPQIKKIKKGSQLIIGTPGRLVDLLKRKKLNLSTLKYLVLDEADEIMNMGFKEDVDFIIGRASNDRQTLLFSATMPKSIKSVVKSATEKPEMVEVAEKPLTEGQIEEITIQTTDRKKYDDLMNYIQTENPYMAIIFCRTKRRVTDLYEKLKEQGYSVDEIHGDLSQAKREKALTKFRKLKTRFLVATDVAARGLDIDGISHVINYDAPERQAEYVHRIGRTGRANEKGIAVTFVVEGHSKGRGFKGKSRGGRNSGGRSGDRRRSSGRNNDRRDSSRNDERRSFGRDDRRSSSRNDERRSSGRDDRRSSSRNDERRSFGRDDRRSSSRNDERRSFGRDDRRSSSRNNDRRNSNGNSKRSSNKPRKSNKVSDLIR